MHSAQFWYALNQTERGVHDNGDSVLRYCVLQLVALGKGPAGAPPPVIQHNRLSPCFHHGTEALAVPSYHREKACLQCTMNVATEHVNSRPPRTRGTRAHQLPLTHHEHSTMVCGLRAAAKGSKEGSWLRVHQCCRRSCPSGSLGCPCGRPPESAWPVPAHPASQPRGTVVLARAGVLRPTQVNVNR